MRPIIYNSEKGIQDFCKFAVYILFKPPARMSTLRYAILLFFLAAMPVVVAAQPSGAAEQDSLPSPRDSLKPLPDSLVFSRDSTS
jgi:hypothetical protein